jgi:hypothetical protein
MTGHKTRIATLSFAALLAGLNLITGSASAEIVSADPTKAAPSEKQTGILLRRDRLMPVPEKDSVPALPTPEGTGDDVKPSSGLTLLDRMGSDLPDPPPEKPFKGMTDEAYGAFQRGLYLTAMNLALPKAQKGDAAAQTLVAELFNNGLGVRRSPDDAVFWYQQAAKGGDPNAQFKYALMLMDGKQIKHDSKAADLMMEKAAAGGNAEAEFNIAQIKVAAAPGEKGLLDALPLYEKAAAQGIPDAEYALSQLYLNLDVSPEKKASARYWLKAAAEAGFDTALYDMGVWYINGIAGPRDYKIGFDWMRKAAIRGHILAANKLAHLYINAIGTRPDPIEAAKWYVISRRAGLADLDLEDFYLGIEDDQQQEAIRRADAFLAR